MIPIEQTRDGSMMFLGCGCSGWRLLPHPTGAAIAVVVVKRCEVHAGDESMFRSVPKGEMVSPFVRTSVTLDPIRPR
jgi:hypothetical protein